MENLELSFPQNLNMEASEKYGTLFGNLQLGDFNPLKQEPINYQQYLNLQPDDDYPSNFSLIDQQLYLDSNYPSRVNQEDSSSRSTASCNQSSQQFEKIPQQNMEKMIQKARRQMYRERAKQRKIQKDSIKQENVLQEKEEFIVQVKQEESVQCTTFPMDPKEQRKQQQQLRNRISAQQSRDKRKKYVQQLEDKQDRLQERIKELQNENDQLKGKVPCGKALFNRETAKIGFVVFSLMALICQVQAKAHMVDEVDVVQYKEMASGINEQQELIVDAEKKYKLKQNSESQQMILEEIQAKQEYQEIKIKNENEELGEAKKKINQKTLQKPIRKQRNKKQGHKSK